MRFHKYFLVVIFLVVSGCYCDGTQTINRAREVLGDGVPRNLHQLGKNSSQENQTTNRFFLVFGSSSSSSQTVPVVSFSWQMSDGTYAFSTIPYEQLRARVDESAEQPTISFKLLPADDVYNDCSDSSSEDIDYLIQATVSYATVVVRPGDWPADVQLP